MIEARSERRASGRSRHRLFVLGDQAASSLSNVLVTVLVANGSSRATFGGFALTMVAYQLTSGGIRSVAGEPLLSLYADQGPRARRGIVADIHGTALFLALVCSGVLVAISVALGGQSGAALLVLAAVLPFVVMQDTWRYLFVIDRPAAALAIDLVWLGGVFVALPLMAAGSPVGHYVWAWGLSGALGAAAGTVLGWGLPSWPHPWRWLVSHRDMCVRYFTEFVTAQGAGQSAFAGLAMISGAAALGAARAAWVVYGGLVVVHSALYMVLVPEGARERHDLPRLRRKFLLASAVSMGISGTWMCVALLAPGSWGEDLFSDTWAKADTLLLPMGLAMVAGGALSGGLLGLRALGDARRSLRARLLSTPVALLCPLGGAFLADATGFVLGLALGNAISAVIWWTMFRSVPEAPADPEAAPEPADGPVDGVADPLVPEEVGA